jgi:DNA replication protein DnaC
LLWVKGDSGKGKTMLLIGIINELHKEAQSMTASKKGIVSYFLCQATDPRLNNATAILRGLIYLLIIQQPSLILHLKKRYGHAGRKLFEDNTALYSLSEIFKEMLHDPGLTTVYLAIDALDECEE